MITMLSVKILGPGCAKCYSLERTARAALEQLLLEQPDLEATLVHIEDVETISRYPVLFTPALVVNEEVVCAGRIPKKDEVLKWYRNALHGN
jgi:small redox-active disulfide protein 2